MAKLKILGISKSENNNYVSILRGSLHYYIFPKKQEIFTIIRNLLKKLGVEYYYYEDFGRPLDKDGEPVRNKEDKIREYIDRHFAFSSVECSIDIIFGKKKVFLLIHTKKDMQQEISVFLKKYIRH